MMKMYAPVDLLKVDSGGGVHPCEEKVIACHKEKWR